MSVALSHLFEQAIIGPDIDVSGLALDSRKVQPNDVFLAYRGHAQNGHDYIAQAIEKVRPQLRCKSRNMLVSIKQAMSWSKICLCNWAILLRVSIKILVSN